MSRESKKLRQEQEREARNAEYQAWRRADWDEKYDINPRQAFLDLVRLVEEFDKC